MTMSRQEYSAEEQAGPAQVAAGVLRAEGSDLPAAGEAQPQPRFRPSRRALLTAGGVTAGAAALAMTRQPAADAQTFDVVQGAQVISVNDNAYGATGNGWTDDTSAIQAALNATPAGGTCLIPPPPTFAFTATHASPCVFTAATTAYTAGMIVILSGTSLPGGFTAGTQYYIVSPSTDTFELSATSGGTGIASTSTGSGNVSAYYRISSTLKIPSGVSVKGPAVAPPAKYRSAGVPTPPQIRVAASSDLNAVISDTAWTSSATTPAASGGILISGLVVDGNSANGGTSTTGGAGHGIVLMGAANSIVNCGVQNVAGSGIVLADQSLAGHNVGASLVENGIYGCRVYGSGNYGIWVQHNVGISDGYLYDSIVDQDFTGSATYEGIHMDSCGDWKVCHNHVYATLGGAYYFSGASGFYIEGNRTDNFGDQGSSGTTYYGYHLVPGAPGGVFSNNQTNQTTVGGGAGNWTHFYVQGGSTAIPVYFANNLVQQTVSITGTATGYDFAGGTGGLTVKGVSGPFVVPSGVSLSATPTLSGTVTFADLGPLLQDTTGPSGYTLGGTSGVTILTWTPPSDGNQHRFTLFTDLSVTTANTGGQININFTDPGGTARTQVIYAGGYSTGYHLPSSGTSTFACQAGQAVTLTQSSAQTAGAATLWADIVGL
jgi:hypothetical protein